MPLRNTFKGHIKLCNGHCHNFKKGRKHHDILILDIRGLMSIRNIKLDKSINLFVSVHFKIVFNNSNTLIDLCNGLMYE